MRWQGGDSKVVEERDFISDYMLYLKVERGLSSNSVHSYKSDLQKLASFAKACGKGVCELESSELNTWVRQLSKSGLSPRSIGRAVSGVRSFFNFLQRDAVISKSPCENLVAPRFHSSLPRHLSEGEVERLLAAPDTSCVEGKRDRAIIELLYATGIRVSELTRVKLGDLSLDKGLLKCSGKGSKQRIIPVGTSALRTIDAYISVRGSLTGESDVSVLFLRTSGASMSRQDVWHLLKKYGRHIGVTGLSPHVLRHSFATHMIQGGADSRTVQLLLGHSDLGTTQAYTHVTNLGLVASYSLYHPRAKTES